MIVYQADKNEFLQDFDDRDIEDVIHTKYQTATGRKVAAAEIRSWRESLGYVARVLRDPDIADDVGVAVEFILPQTAKRIDVILAGHADDGSRRLVVIELKQWSAVDATDRDAIVLLRGVNQSAQVRVTRAIRLGRTRPSWKASMKPFTKAALNFALVHTCTTTLQTA